MNDESCLKHRIKKELTERMVKHSENFKHRITKDGVEYLVDGVPYGFDRGSSLTRVYFNVLRSCGVEAKLVNQWLSKPYVIKLLDSIILIPDDDVLKKLGGSKYNYVFYDYESRNFVSTFVPYDGIDYKQIHDAVPRQTRVFVAIKELQPKVKTVKNKFNDKHRTTQFDYTARLNNLVDKIKG